MDIKNIMLINLKINQIKILGEKILNLQKKKYKKNGKKIISVINQKEGCRKNDYDY